jgi:hypothetical protein
MRELPGETLNRRRQYRHGANATMRPLLVADSEAGQHLELIDVHKKVRSGLPGCR